jgi:hypothetical protein
MYRVRRRFTRLTWLDVLVYRFQHRWETNSQFRAAATGLIGLIVVIGMCSCMGVTGAVANRVLAGTGSGPGIPNLDTGTGKLAAATAFPTYTVPASAPGAVPPVGPIPNSQTPAPGPTATDTPPPATPTDTPGPGGPLPTTCSGGSHGGSWSFSPCPVVHGQTVTLTISAPGMGNSAVYIVVNWSQASSCTWLLNSNLSGGSGTFSTPVPACGANSQVPLSGEININNAYVMLIDAAPVQ